jgi:hypothetical protein
MEIDYVMLEEYVEVLKAMAFEPNGERVMVTNLLPQPLYTKFKHINRFYFFKWNYHYSVVNQSKTYQEIFFPERMIKHVAEVSTESKNIKTNYYILDSQVFRNFVNDVRYFYGIRLLKDEDIADLKADLLCFIDYMETLAVNGFYEENNNKVYMYISDIHIDTSYSYIDSQSIKFSMIWAFIFNGISTYDEKIFETIKIWLRSIIRTSTLISVTGEKQRTLYFERQREIVNEL